MVTFEVKTRIPLRNQREQKGTSVTICYQMPQFKSLLVVILHGNTHELDHDYLRGEGEGDYMWPIGQVRSQVWCRPYLVVLFSFFDLRAFPWSLSKA